MYLLPFMDGDAKARGTEPSYRLYNILSGCPKDTQGLQELSETYSLPLIPRIAWPLGRLPIQSRYSLLFPMARLHLEQEQPASS